MNCSWMHGGVSMKGKPRDFTTGSLKGLKAKVEEKDYSRIFPKERYILIEL